MVADHGSYFITTYRRSKLTWGIETREKEKEKKEKKKRLIIRIKWKEKKIGKRKIRGKEKN